MDSSENIAERIQEENIPDNESIVKISSRIFHSQDQTEIRRRHQAKSGRICFKFGESRQGNRLRERQFYKRHNTDKNFRSKTTVLYPCPEKFESQTDQRPYTFSLCNTRHGRS